MEDAKRNLKTRTQTFALQIIRLYRNLPRTTEAQILGKQVVRSGTSVGAHYREASRARSTAEFISKIEGGIQELDETMYWLELLVAAEILPQRDIADIDSEAEELMAMLVSSSKTAKLPQTKARKLE